MEFLIIIFLISIVVGIIRMALKDDSSSTLKNRQIDLTVETIDEPEDYANGAFNTFIAGINHHCDKSDIGGFVGIVAPEPNNPYDKNAVAIYRSNFNPKLLGYIGKSDLAKYRKWCECKPFTCVGYITEGDDAPVYGRLKVIKPYNEKFVRDETDSYVRWMINKYGEAFLPNGYLLNDPNHQNHDTKKIPKA